METVIIAGKLGKDATLAQTQSGKDVCNFSVAVDTWDGREKGTRWWRVSLWGARAKSLSPHLLKGSAVTVSGRFDLGEYDGKPQLNLTANDVTLQGGRSGQQTNGSQSQGGGATADTGQQYDDLDDDIPF